MEGGGLNGRRKKRRRTERVLSDSHSPGDMTGLAIQSVSPCHPLPGTIFLAALHTHPPAEHTHTHTYQLYLTPSCLPAAVSSLPATLHLSVQDNPSPTPQIPSLSKKIFPRAWIAGSHMLRSRTIGKGAAHMQMRRDTHTHIETYKTWGLSQNANDSICLSQIITLHPPPVLFFPLSISIFPRPGEILVFVNMENSRIIDSPGIVVVFVVVVCSPYPCWLMWITRSDEQERQGLAMTHVSLIEQSKEANLELIWCW